VASAHTREIADLKNAGLNPILSSKNAGAPTGAGAMAQTPDYSKSYGSGVANALMIVLNGACVQATLRKIRIQRHRQH
jgi:hypothetical protein